MSREALYGEAFEALGDANRRAIVELLHAGDRSVRELADALPISRPAVSRHLRLLKLAGLVVDRAEGNRRLYRLHDEGIDAVREYLEGIWGEAAARFRLAAENTSDPPAGGMMEALELEFTVACSPEHAFDVWANRPSLWWPTSHSISGETGLDDHVRTARRRARVRTDR